MEYLNETFGYLSVYGRFNGASTPFGRIASRNGFKLQRGEPATKTLLGLMSLCPSRSSLDAEARGHR